MISGVWGYVTNKHLAEIPGTGFLLNTQSYGRLHCLPVVLRVFGRESVYSCRIDKPLITAYNRVIILNCYNREMQKLNFLSAVTFRGHLPVILSAKSNGAPYIKTIYGMDYQWIGGESK